MVDHDIIEASYRAWSAPMCVVLKKSGKSHLCVDLRKFNDVMEDDVHPLPLIEDLLKDLADLGTK